MGEGLSKFAGKIEPTEEEQEEVIHFKTHELQSIKNKLDLSLVGKVHTTKPFSIFDLKTEMLAAWKPTEDIKIKELDDNVFLFVLGNMEEKQRVLDNAPWSFEDHFLVLNCADGTVSPSEIKLNHLDTWVQVHNMPLMGMNVIIGKRVANYLGNCLEVEEQGDGECWGRFMRLKVKLDVSKPLRRRVRIRLQNCKSVWVDFKYEGMLEFCYYCRKLEVIKECNSKLRCRVRMDSYGDKKNYSSDSWSWSLFQFGFRFLKPKPSYKVEVRYC